MSATISEFLAEYLAMGGHGSYVWSAYGITALVLLVSGWAARERHRRALTQARAGETDLQPARQPRVTDL